MTQKLSHRVKRVSQLDVLGGGQIVVDGDYAFIGHTCCLHTRNR